MAQTLRRSILGLDPGLANFGWAVLSFEKEGPARVENFGTFETEKSDKKRKVLASDDNVRRALLLAAFLNGLFKGNSPVAVCAEAMSFPRNSSNAAKTALSWGCIVAFSELHHVPILQASPQAVKIHMCATKTASKEDVQRAVWKLYPPVKEAVAERPPTHTQKQWEATWEHSHDAIAAAHTMLESTEVRLVRRML